MLKLDGIVKQFDDKKVLKGVSFQLENNSITGLLGPNGAGKTTLMKIIVGFLTANKGSIYWNGKKVNTESLINKKRIGYLPENNPLYLNMTVFEYL